MPDEGDVLPVQHRQLPERAAPSRIPRAVHRHEQPRVGRHAGVRRTEKPKGLRL